MTSPPAPVKTLGTEFLMNISHVLSQFLARGTECSCVAPLWSDSWELVPGFLHNSRHVPFPYASLLCISCTVKYFIITISISLSSNSILLAMSVTISESLSRKSLHLGMVLRTLNTPWIHLRKFEGKRRN